jgi:hypothetical protein
VYTQVTRHATRAHMVAVRCSNVSALLTIHKHLEGGEVEGGEVEGGEVEGGEVEGGRVIFTKHNIICPPLSHQDAYNSPADSERSPPWTMLQKKSAGDDDCDANG